MNITSYKTLSRIKRRKHLTLYYFSSLLLTPFISRGLNYDSKDHVRSDIKYSMFTFSDPPVLFFSLVFILTGIVFLFIIIMFSHRKVEPSQMFNHAFQDACLTNILIDLSYTAITHVPNTITTENRSKGTITNEKQTILNDTYSHNVKTVMISSFIETFKVGY